VSTSAPGPGRIIAVVGLAREARIAAGAGVHPIIGGGEGPRLSANLDRAVGGGARAILSFGIAGGLDPLLRPGDCIIATAVSAQGRRWPTHVGWAAKLAARLPGAFSAEIAGADHPLATVADKRRLRAAGGAAAVDMESHIAARIAADHGLPFAVIRIVCDPAERSLTPAALVGMRPDGTSDVGAVIRALIAAPGQFPDLIRLALDARNALAQLKRRRMSLSDDFLLGTFDVHA
jgi:adenosylhomocysteine nucleosidase